MYKGCRLEKLLRCDPFDLILLNTIQRKVSFAGFPAQKFVEVDICPLTAIEAPYVREDVRLSIINVIKQRVTNSFISIFISL